MSLGLVAPDWRAALQVALTDALSVPVSTQVPNPRPDEFVTLEGTGGPGRAGVVHYGVTVMYRGWGLSEPAAWNVASAARSALWGVEESIVAGVQFYRVREAGGLALVPDPVSASPRWQGTFSLWVRETVDA